MIIIDSFYALLCYIKYCVFIYPFELNMSKRNVLEKNTKKNSIHPNKNLINHGLFREREKAVFKKITFYL